MTTDNNKKKVQRAYFLSEVAYDAYFFNEFAYENLLKFIEKDPDEKMLVIDGALTRLDRPEILNHLLTFWHKTESECRKASEDVHNYEQSQKMLDIQIDQILDKRLAELRKRFPDKNNTKLVLCIDNDDTQYTVSQMLKELLINRRAQIGTALKELAGEKKKLTADHKRLQQEFQKDQPTLKLCKTKREKINGQIKALKKIEADIVASEQELNLFREQKVRPTHQFVTKTFVERLGQRYKEICKKYKVKFIDHPMVLKFGESADDFTIKYTHSGHKTWVPVLKRDESITRSVLANQTQYNNLIKKIAGAAEAERVDAHVESGHHGIGYATTQKLKDDPAETNFQGNADYDPMIAPQKDYVKICLAIPFEDQERIARFMENQEQVRMSIGKPIGSRSHEVFRRFSNESVSGMFMLTRSEDGLIWTRYIQYQNFKDGSVLKQPERYWATWATSDEHLGDPAENPMVRDGFQALFEEHAKKPFNFYGKPVHLGGYMSGGDTGEPPLVAWNRRYDHRRSPTKLLKENIEKLARLDPTNPEAVLDLALQMTSDTMDGQSHSAAVMMERVAEWYTYFLDILLSVNSPLQFAVVVTKGNHGDGPLRSVGIGEDNNFKVRLEERKIGVLEVGLSAHYKKSPYQVRVGLGGYSDARIIHIPDYGLDVNGKPLFGPISLLVHHDPQGPGTSGLVGAARKVGADNACAGHTHENWTKLFRIGLNQFRIAQRLSTVNGVTVIEKLYASSPPRTQAAHVMLMIKPGDYAEKTIPAAYLRQIGYKNKLQFTEGKIATVKNK
jgi:hypothetical protein